ncbi:putative late blight resistance protein homolog R1C-3 [Salvia splendens]|uniref:putative late blight resistance protein homolog R1C-3 n=1 Tax=Salvia splendens TaxID=180675 RepID=UPI001C27ED3C|nr:putative late blight resistance protein homolog R1C-3 [Salvia splendens]
MDRKVIRSDWSMVDALNGRNYREVDWSMINLLFDSSKSKRSINRRAIGALDAQIRDTTWKLEDVIQSHVLSFPLFHPLGDIFSFLEIESGLINEYIIELEEHNKNSDTMEQEIHSFSKTVNMLEKEYIAELCTPLHREEDETVVLPADKFGGENSIVIGLFDQIEQIRNELLDLQSGNQVVSLFGMAGIGKTRLAREIYQDQITVQHFDYTAWLSIGPSNEMGDILADIVSQIERKPIDVYIEEDRYTLAMFLQRCLQGRRFLIVLDDIWSIEVCDYLIGWLPIHGNGKVLLTTRLEEVAICQNASFHQVPFLDHEDSWNLLWRNVFGGESFPPQLEKVGRKIAELCEGLPLLILAVASILCEFEKTEEYWNKVVVKQTTTFTDAYEMIYKVLISSYEYLPQHLKPYFLYMGVFPQRCVIRLSKLIDLWFVEDLFVPRVKDSEDFARGCMKGLVSNSLAIICKQSYNNTIIKSCKLHSAYWHLCIKEAKRIKFLLVLNKLADASEDYLESQRRLAVQNNVLFGIKEAYDCMPAASTARSLLCTGEDHQYPVPLCLNLTLLKVLDALSVRLYEFPEEVMKLLLLRYLSLTHNGKVPSSISKLQNLQFLILSQHHNIKFLKDSMQEQSSNQLLRDSTCLPNEIWDMQQLKHLRIPKHKLPDPSNGTNLPNLFTLYVNAHSCTDDVFKSIPNLKKLGISIDLLPDGAETLSLENIGILNQLV